MCAQWGVCACGHVHVHVCKIKNCQDREEVKDGWRGMDCKDWARRIQVWNPCSTGRRAGGSGKALLRTLQHEAK